MICLGTLNLPLYICPYSIPSAYTGVNFHSPSNDPVIVNGWDSNNASLPPFSIFAPGPFDYGITNSYNIYSGNPTAYACINGSFVSTSNKAVTGSGTGYSYNFYNGSYVKTGGNESINFFSPLNYISTSFSGFTGGQGNYGFVTVQPFPIPQAILNNLSIVPQYKFMTLTGPGTGFTDAVVVSTPYGNNVGPQGYNLCYNQISPAFNFQLSGLTPKFNRVLGLFPMGSQWYGINWSLYQILTTYGTPISLPNSLQFTPITIDDNPTLNSSFNNANIGTNSDPNQLMTNDYFFTAVLKGVSSFAGMASTILMIFPDRGYYINVNLTPKTPAAAAAIANQNFTVQYDRGGYFMLINPQVNNAQIFNTVPLSVDFTFPPLPKNAINPLPCFNNAIEGLIVG